MMHTRLSRRIGRSAFETFNSWTMTITRLISRRGARCVPLALRRARGDRSICAAEMRRRGSTSRSASALVALVCCTCTRTYAQDCNRGPEPAPPVGNWSRAHRATSCEKSPGATATKGPKGTVSQCQAACQASPTCNFINHGPAPIGNCMLYDSCAEPWCNCPFSPVNGHPPGPISDLWWTTYQLGKQNGDKQWPGCSHSLPGPPPPPVPPTWSANWNLTQSTTIQPSSNGYFEPVHEWGLISLDWSVAKSVWMANGRNATNCEFISTEGCRRLKAAGKATRCFIYHNM